ncbi:MAG: hypothetical protein EPN89_20210 [Methylovulum sp.]|nr:MAG: hypothetical protein EPN89_20210 [Methylovulum sp.]
MLAQALRLVRGQSPNGGAGVLNEKLQIRSGSTDEIIASMNAKLLYATGDVTIQNTGLSGSLEFDPKTLFIYGGDMYINTNILGRAGIVVLKKNGQGGNIYIDPSVTDINANIFADGSVFSSSTAYDANGVPTRSSDDARLTDLPHQLAIFGTVVSRNTIGGFSDPNAGTWNTGNGETTNNSDTAIEYDLNKLRQFRLCYPVDSGGNIIEDDSLLEDCGEGAERSTLYTGTSNAPLIIQYEPPTEDMPIFNTVSPDINQR